MLWKIGQSRTHNFSAGFLNIWYYNCSGVDPMEESSELKKLYAEYDFKKIGLNHFRSRGKRNLHLGRSL